MPVANWHAQIGDPTAADSIQDRLVLRCLTAIQFSRSAGKAAFLGNLNTDTFVGTRSGDYYSVWDTGERLKQYNFYGQDEWRARKNPTVTYGVRWEIDRPPTESRASRSSSPTSRSTARRAQLRS